MGKFLKILISLFFIVILNISPLKAGDSALSNIIGYSKDGRYFAFEEFGIQDGSGFTYSSIYILDLKDDSWVVGTPIKVILGEDEQEPFDYQKLLKATRDKAFEQAQFRLDGLEINWPAITLAYNGDGVPSKDGYFIDEGLELKFVVPGYNGGIKTDIYKLSLEKFKTKSALSCVDWFGEQAMGFLLKLKEGESEAKEVHRDEALPRSRNCPFTYKISAIYTPFEAIDIKSAVALISVFSFGYEGADRRFIVVPIGNK